VNLLVGSHKRMQYS